jgi:hypothetical protein
MIFDHLARVGSGFGDKDIGVGPREEIVGDDDGATVGETVGATVGKTVGVTVGERVCA